MACVSTAGIPVVPTVAGNTNSGGTAYEVQVAARSVRCLGPARTLLLKMCNAATTSAAQKLPMTISVCGGCNSTIYSVVDESGTALTAEVFLSGSIWLLSFPACGSTAVTVNYVAATT